MFLIIVGLISLVAGTGIGFFTVKKMMEKQLRDNPPINEQMIKMMMMQMGTKPSQKKVNQIMNAMNKKIS
ncbi:YneF family protein [[Brevibacterium] frigoritolerans]|nr:YneF family protein [Peribacillus frigoritolerans]